MYNNNIEIINHIHIHTRTHMESHITTTHKNAHIVAKHINTIYLFRIDNSISKPKKCTTQNIIVAYHFQGDTHIHKQKLIYRIKHTNENKEHN